MPNIEDALSDYDGYDRPIRVIVMGYSESEEKLVPLFMDGGAMQTQPNEKPSTSVTKAASGTNSTVFEGAGFLTSVINGTTENLEIYDGTIGGGGTLIALVLPGLSITAPITITNGVYVKSLGIAPVGVSTLLYRLAG